jgi:hypothetical protein
MPSEDDTSSAASREDRLAERGRAIVARAVGETRASPRLRERLERQRSAAAPARRRRRLALGGLTVGSAALVLVLALLVLPGGAPGGPTVVQAAKVGAQGPQHRAPGRDPADRRLLAAGEGGVRFPAWQAFDWYPSGARVDRVDGRHVTTVFYETTKGVPVAYSIVGGAPLGRIDGGTTRTMGGVDVTTARRDGRWIVAWERGGRTCILTAPTSVPLRQLVALPAWR